MSGLQKAALPAGVPIQTNIPEVIRLLKANKLDEAGRMLFGQHRTIPAGAVLRIVRYCLRMMQNCPIIKV